jgi:hypothetical protein
MDEERAALWTIVGVLCGFKLITVLLIFLMAPSLGAALLLTVFHWFWLIPPALVLGGAAAAWVRRTRVRAKRARLLRAEFSIDEPAQRR